MTTEASNLEGWEIQIEEDPSEVFDSLEMVGTNDEIPIPDPDESEKPRPPIDELPQLPSDEPPDEMFLEDELAVYDGNDALTGEGEITIKVDDEDPVTYSFELPKIPGADDQDDYEPANLIIEEPDEDVVIEHDPWSWSIPMFPQWLTKMLQNVPRHSGRDTVGLERATAYMEYLDREISKAVRSDIKGELPIDELANARKEIQDGIDRLKKRYEDISSAKKPKKKKKASTDDSMVKEGKAAGFTVVVPLFISSIARTCINSMVSAGKDIEDCFRKISDEYNLAASIHNI